MPFNVGDPQNEIENHIYKLEADHLRKKSLIVNFILIGLLFPILVVLYFFNVPFLDLSVYIIVFIFMIAINFLFYYYRFLLPNIRLSMYITSMGLYIITISMILDLRTPSIFTMLFFSYAVISLYQDLRVSLFNSVLLFFSGIFIVTQFTEIFDVQALTPSTFYILFFLVIFVALLSVSSFIIIKRKNHFYKQVVDIKEKEYKYIDTIFDLQEIFSERKFNYDEYYDNLESFSEALSNHIGVENVFKERINILRDLANVKDNTILKKHSDYNQADIDELKQLELTSYKKISYLAFKSAQVQDIQPDKKELIFEKESATLNDRNDDFEVKIVAFSVLYVMLRVGNIYFPKLSNNDVIKVFSTPHFRSLIHEDILNAFLDKKNTLDKIIRGTGGIQ